MDDARGARLLEIDPEIGRGLTDAELAEATRMLVLPVAALAVEPWDPLQLLTAAGVRGDVLGFLVLSGALTVDVWIGGRTCRRLVGGGELMLCDRSGTGSIPVRRGWSVLEPSRLALLDDRLLLAGRRWPALFAGVFERAGQHVAQALLQQAISQLPRVEDRLLAFFWSVADRRGVMRADGVWVSLPVTHDVLGAMIGARRPTVSLGLRRLADRGLLRTDGTGWLLDSASLTEFAEPADERPPDLLPTPAC